MSMQQKNSVRATLLRRQVERNNQILEEKRQVQEQLAAERAKAVRDSVETVSILRCVSVAKLDGEDPRLKKITNLVLGRFDAHVQAGEPGATFRVYDVWNEMRARVMAEGGSEGSGSGLPSFRSKSSQERAAMNPAQLAAEDARYREALRKMGLEDPATGMRGNGGPFGY